MEVAIEVSQKTLKPTPLPDTPPEFDKLLQVTHSLQTCSNPQDCWNFDSTQRPSFAIISQRLEAIIVNI